MASRAAARIRNEDVGMDGVVSSSALRRFFSTLDRDKDGLVDLQDLYRLTRGELNVCFGLGDLRTTGTEQNGHHESNEQEDGTDDNPLCTMSFEEQHLYVLRMMYYDALTLRSTGLFTKSLRPTRAKSTARQSNGYQRQQHEAGSDDPMAALSYEDIAAVFHVRPQLLQSSSSPASAGGSNTSKRGMVRTTGYRTLWMRLLQAVVPQPFEGRAPSRAQVVKRSSSHSTRIQSNYEKHQAATSNKSSPHPPRPSIPSCYSFSSPRIRSRALTPRELSSISRANARMQSNEAGRLTPHQRKLQALLKVLESRASSAMEREETNRVQSAQSRNSAMGSTTSDGSMWIPSSTAATSRPASSVTHGHGLMDTALNHVSFKTKEQFDAMVGAARLESEALECKEDIAVSDDQAQSNNEDMSSSSSRASSSNAFAHALMASFLATAKGNMTQRQGTMTERVQEALASSRQSYSKSAQYKTKMLLSQKDGSQSARPGPPSARRPVIEYDSLGRPIKTPRRSPLTERLVADEPGSHRPRSKSHGHGHRNLRDAWDEIQAKMLAFYTDKQLQQLPPHDPLDDLLHPFVPRAHLSNSDPIEAFRKALEEVPSMPGMERARKISSHREGSRSSSPNGHTTTRQSLSDSILQSSRSSSSPHHRGASTSPRRLPLPSRPDFTLNFHIPSPQDERLHAARNLSIFGPDNNSQSQTARSPAAAAGAVPPSSSARLVRPGSFHRDESVGDVSLLPSSALRLKISQERAQLNNHRPPFRLDFTRPFSGSGSQTGTQEFEANVIARDGGLVSAEEHEALLRAELGLSRDTQLDQWAQQRLQHAHTHGKVVRSDHLGVGVNTARHPKPFSALTSRNSSQSARLNKEHVDLTGERYVPMHVSERYASMRAAGLHEQFEAELERDKRIAAHAALTPSQRKAMKKQQEMEQRKKQFPFVPLDLTALTTTQQFVPPAAMTVR